jgi:cleavage stimulation factor subunit 3
LYHDEINKKYDLEAETLRQSLIDGTKKDSVPEEEWDGERRDYEREIQKGHDNEINEKVEVYRLKKIEEIKSSISLTWIIYMRFTRRSQNIKAARLVFSKSRKSTLITNHVYTSSALMEFYVNKDPIVAGKIFELGMKTFNMNEDVHATTFICRYIDFLICLNDDNNTRALFERALATIPAQRSRPIWAKYINYETQYGDLTNLHKLQQRRAMAFPKENMDLLESVVNVAEKWSRYHIF